MGTSLQPSCYANPPSTSSTGEEPARRIHVVLVKTKTPKDPADRGRPECFRRFRRRLGDIIEAVGRSIEAESFYPIESPINCSGCGFYRECKSWSGPGSSSSGIMKFLKSRSPPHADGDEWQGRHPLLTSAFGHHPLSADRSPDQRRRSSPGTSSSCSVISTPVWWLSDLLNSALGTNRFRRQFFRRLKIQLWVNQPYYPPRASALG